MTTLTILSHILPAMAILAADKKDLRARIRGVYLEVSAKEIRFAATNGAVMGVYRIKQDNPDLLAKLKKFGKAINNSKNGYFAIAYNGEATAIADFHLGNLLAVIMPLRNDEKYRAAPESPAWAREFI
jgi:hypothetical protein